MKVKHNIIKKALLLLLLSMLLTSLGAVAQTRTSEKPNVCDDSLTAVVGTHSSFQTRDCQVVVMSVDQYYNYVKYKTLLSECRKDVELLEELLDLYQTVPKMTVPDEEPLRDSLPRDSSSSDKRFFLLRWFSRE